MRFVSIVSMLMMLWSSNALSSPDDLNFSGFDNTSKGVLRTPRGVYRYEGSAPGGVLIGTYTPYNREPMWKRARVFLPSIRMVRVPLVALPLIAGTVPAYFSIKKYFSDPS